MRIIFLLVFLALPLTSNAAKLVRIAAAADLQPAATEIDRLFKAHYPDINIVITYGSSGVLTSQLRNGAPFEVFIAANEDYPALLVSENLTASEGIIYAFSRIAFISHEKVNANSAIEAIKQWQTLKKPSDKLAIANPIHAPNGVAAMSWINHWQLNDTLSTDLVFGESAAQSVQFVLSGAARSGIVAWPLLAKRKDLPSNTWLIPDTEHAPSPRAMVLMHNASDEARAFYDFMQADVAIQVLREYGFGVP